MGGSSNGSAGEMGEHFPKISFASVGQSHPEFLPQSPKSSLPRALPSGATTPRGCRFPSLDEAHRNITGRSTSALTTQREASFARDPDFFEDIPLQDLSSSRTRSARQGSSDTMGSDASPYPVSYLQSTSTRNPFDLGPVPNPFHKHGHLLGGFSNPSIGVPSYSNLAGLQGISMPSEASDNTVDRIYKQYQSCTPENNRIALENNDQIVETTSQVDSSPPNLQTTRSRDGATNRLGFRPEEPHEDSYFNSDSLDHSTSGQEVHQQVRMEWDWGGSDEKDGLQVARTPRGAVPALSLPHLPSPTFEVQRFTSAIQAAKTAVSAPIECPNTQDPNKTIPIPFEDNDGAWDTDPGDENDMEQPGPLRPHHLSSSSMGRGYLNGLHSATGMTTESDDDPFKYDKASYTMFLHPSKEREVSAALQRVSCLSNHSKGTLYSPDGSLVGNSEEHPPLPADAATQVASVSTRKTPSSKWPRGGVYKTDGEQTGAPFGITVVRPDNPYALNERNMKIGGFLKDKKKEKGRVDADADGGDWETVATSGAALGSGRLSFPTREYYHPNGFNMTGSSIADVSDRTSCYDEGAAECGSMDRIIRHPNDAWPQGYQVREVQGSKNVVYLPKQQVHRVNGFAQDSCRMISTPGGSSVLARKLSDPFRQLSRRRKHRFTPFSYGKADQESHFDHGQARDPAVKELWDRNGKQPMRAIGDGHPIGVASPGMTAPGSKFSFDRTGTEKSHSFSFDLIPLPEAARIQRIRRDSGLEDPLSTGKVRPHRALSGASSFMLERTTSTMLPLPQVPEPAYRKPRVPLFPGLGGVRGT